MINAGTSINIVAPHLRCTTQDNGTALLTATLPRPAREAIIAFAEGIRPSQASVRLAVELAETVVEKAVAYEVTQDDTDGSLSIEAKTAKGHLITGELSLTGDFGIDVYQDEPAPLGMSEINVDDLWLEHLPQASAHDLSKRL